MKTYSWNKTLLLFFCLSITFSALSANGERITRSEYIDAWKDVAIANMLEYKIPASITLAQAILESGDGNSELAKMSNNHFGIKCHGWEGEKVYYDDDAKGECFRKYEDAGASFADHSEFLMRKRYASLFQLKMTDYKGWARGLKKCGYATDPAYAKLLIGIIEKYELHKYDSETSFNEELVAQNDPKEETEESQLQEIPEQISLIQVREIKISDNNIKYVASYEGDTIEKISKDLQIPLFLLKKYNDLDSEYSCARGEIIYIQPKRKRAKKKATHIVKQGQSMREISQMYGVKLKTLYKKNNMKFGSEPKEGDKISLKEKVIS